MSLLLLRHIYKGLNASGTLDGTATLDSQLPTADRYAGGSTAGVGTFAGLAHRGIYPGGGSMSGTVLIVGTSHAGRFPGGGTFSASGLLESTQPGNARYAIGLLAATGSLSHRGYIVNIQEGYRTTIRHGSPMTLGSLASKNVK